MLQADIFDRDDIWRSRPLDAFCAFIRSTEFVELGRYAATRRSAGKPVRPLKEASAQIYLHMFTNYLRWLSIRGLHLHAVSAQDIMAFLDAGHVDEQNRARKLKSLIRVRYLRLLERVYAHLQIEPNPARHAAFDVYRTPAAGHDKPKAYLTEGEQANFLEQLPPAPPFDEAHPAAPSWKKRRDRAMLATILGAGLRVSEVLTLRIDQVEKRERDGSIPIKIPDYAAGGDGHRTVLRPFAVKHVLPWIEERKRRPIPSKLLFPASLDAGEPLHKATVYRHVKATMQKAGIDVDRMGGRTLRNSFAIRELQSGASLELVKQYMGHHELRSTEKYLPAIQKRRRPKAG
jgi:integrase/recombinase XerD